MSAPRELITAAAARLTAAGVRSPRVDAELLLAHCLGVERSRLVLVEAVPPDAAERFDRLLARRADRVPLQHIVGSAPFRHVLPAVGAGVFVPRPETELLVDAVLPMLRAAVAPVAVDLCAGSGALALAIADEVPGTRVVAVERSDAALTWLRRNADGTAIDVVAGDVTDPALLSDLHGRVDAVVCNPPYVPVATPVDPEVRADPAEAVFAGADGLGVMPAVIARAADLLKSGGLLAVEHDDSHGTSVPALLDRDGRWRGVDDRRDLAGCPRYAVAIRR
ncbi:MAG: modification methylase, HemK family [Pseudonocardiales bacterium]|nr:modification methylase, HemK family [Pseudonocardiales bacterium]